MTYSVVRTERSATLRIVAVYALVAGLWIYLSDTILGAIVNSPEDLVRVSVLKGLFFIAITATVLYHLITRQLRKSGRIEEDLNLNRNLTASLIEGTTDSVFVKDLQGRYLMANTAAADITGKAVGEVLGNDDAMLFSAEEARLVMAQDRRVMDAGQVMTFEETLTAADGTSRIFLSTKGPIFDAGGEVSGVFGISRDITGLRRAEQRHDRIMTELYHARKMEAMGRLAGGVAHDFNNILTAIIGFSEKITRLTDESPVRDCAEKISASAKRAAGLTHDLLTFSRKQAVDPRPTDLNEVIGNNERLLAMLVRNDIDLRLELHAGPLVASVDGGRMEQVLMNLVTNAGDAMPNGGSITIRTERVCLGPEFMGSHGLGKPGDYVCMQVTDCGCGIPQDKQEAIFEPFFTTKEAGKGTGLGLSIVHGIVSQHKGHIEVESAPGNGTTFRIYLPLLATSGDA